MNNDEEKDENLVDKAKEIKEDVEIAERIAANAASGNWIGVAKDVLKKLKDKNFIKKKLKEFFIKNGLKMLLGLALAAMVFGVFNSMKDKMIDLLGMAQSKIGGFFSEAWQWLTNDYWVDLDEKFEYVVDLNTGETLGTTESIKNTYTDEKGNIVDSNGNKYDENGNILDSSGKIRETTTKEYTIVDQYVRELGNNGVSIKELRLLGDADYGNKNLEELLADDDNKELIKKYIAEFIRADIITQQPHRNRTEAVVNPNDQYQVDGGVYFYRNIKDPELKEEDFNKGEYNEKDVEVNEKDYKRMTYLTPEEFMKELGKEGSSLSDLANSGEIIKTNNKSVGEKLRYSFTIDPETENMVLLEIKTIKTKESKISSKDGWFQNLSKWFQETNSRETSYELKVVEKDYKGLISKYSMPYEFLINLCEITQNPEFVYHVALLARDTKITLVIQDNTDQIIETNEIEQDWEKWKNSEESGGTFEGASLINSETIKIRKITTTTTNTPVLRPYSADTCSFYERFKYTKDIEGTIEEGELITTTFPKPSKLSHHEEEHEEMSYEGVMVPVPGYYWDEFVIEEREKTQIITSKITYNEATIAQSVEKSKQFLGLLRNSTGTCKYNCSEDKLSLKYDPIALKCAKEAEFDRHGINVQYRIPNMTRTESPYSKLVSGIDMLYATLQSNSTGYNEKDKLLTEEQTSQKYDIQDQYIADKDYESAYVVKMQGLVEHLQYLMTFPENEEYDPEYLEDNIDDNNYDDSEDEIDIEDIIVKTDEPGAAPEVTREELVTIINTAYKSSESMKSNAFSLLDVLMSGQDNCKVNPVFMLAVVSQETSVGTANTTHVNVEHNWPSYNLGHVYKDGPESVNTAINAIAYGEKYFTQGKYTIREIGYTYCPNTDDYPTQGDNWVQQVTGKVKYYYSLIGQKVGEDEDGDGTYVGIYTSRINGRTYKIYRQQDYPNTKYGSGTISSKGCGLTSDSIVLSAYGKNYTPKQLLDGRNIISIDGELRARGVNATRTVASKEKIRNALNEGKTVIVHVNSSSSYTRDEHWMPLVDIKNNEVYVINPNKYGREGWDSLDNVIIGCTEIIIVG